MKAVILAGGQGTRLRPLTNDIPKPMVPIIDKPILEYIIRLLREHGISDIAMAIGYKASHIVRYFGDGRAWGVHIDYFMEEKPLGTAGAIKNMEEYLGDDFLVMSGDALTDIDLTSLMRYHMMHDSMVTMALHHVDNPSEFGVVIVNENGKILAFEEKPKNPTSHLVNMGIYVMNKEILKHIAKGQFLDLSKDIFSSILPYMYGYSCSCYWSDIGTLSSYYLANNYVVTNRSSFGVSL